MPQPVKAGLIQLSVPADGVERSVSQFLVKGSRDQDQLVVADLDLDQVRQVRELWQFFRDRRLDLYGDLIKP
ncbi:hypothetical protein [Thermostichus vulcanus]|uniref:Uncharacterized protein n=1 Tax=Thermostichus vulcanus str. 'Rupite' TaxID=2813851 RepID=A0ABT0C6F7_THEVL|nr:hypothetical protein [Thermostichus vulcanus]MCJ2541324.1 hypothetical protein [Thermostichus vulcanus str. 'Rupite']